MKTQWATVRVLCGVVVFVMTVVGRHEATGQATPKVPEGWTFTFPQGNSKDGQTVFTRMECSSCHAMKGLKEKPPTGAGGIGPDLSNYGTLPKEYLAESIIKAHAVVAAPGYVVKEGKAGMGNYNHFLTIQELIDLVAFLKHGPRAEAK